MVGDASVWSPAGGRPFEDLWFHLRLLFCRAVWALRSRRAVLGQGFTAAAVVALTASWVERAVRLDWALVSGGLACEVLRVLGSRSCLTLGEFRARWCLGGVLATVGVGAAAPVLLVHVPRGAA